ncbi:MAG TPA: peptidoglycan-binding protein [bacterium]|nr:peptidoglycan-binding protein [bacterium]
MAVKPMLDDVELQQVQEVEAEEQETLAQQSVPALDGDFLQDLGRRATRLSVSGVLSDDHAGEGLKKLREKFQTAAPVPFTADIAAATKVDKVLIEEIGVREVAGKPARFEYAFTLREFVPPPQPKVEPPPPPPPPPPSVDTGTLAVEVIVEGQPNFDFSTVTVSVDGTKDDGSPFSKTLANRANNVWTEDKMPPGQYTARAVVTDPPMSGSAGAAVRRGQTTKVTITLKAGPPVAVTFVVHFKFDKAFVEPCMLEVLKHVTDFATAHPDRKLLIVGHTDLVGSDDYNQSLSERRGRAVFAALTFGRDQAGAVAEWNVLRRRATGALPSVSDTWGTREYQYMLQDLGYYSGAIDEQHGPETDVAVRSFQQDQSLPVTGLVDDVTWSALIQAYLGQEPLSVPESQFFRNAANGCDGGIVKWLGCGEKDPVKNTQDAWRPNRRCEMLFVNADHIPCQVAKPVTFDLPAPGAGGTSWCLGPGDPKQRCCFTARKEPQPGKFLIQPVDPSTVVISGTITFEDGTPAANLDFVLTAPDGEYMNGERPTGRPIPGRTGDDGSFSFPGNPKHPGICTLEVLGPFLARSAEDPPDSEHETVVCFALTAGAATPTAPAAGVTQAPRANVSQAARGARAVVNPPPKAPVNPTIALASPAVLVKKPHTSPARQKVTLRTSTKFPRPGTFTRSSANIRFFTAASGGTEITFDGTDNVFTGAQLSAGVQLFAEAAAASAGPNDVTLTLALSPGAIPVGAPATATMTAVQLDLDIFMSRTAAGVDPAPLPQPTGPPAPGTTPTDKWFGGRFAHVQDAGNHHGRALMTVKVQPAGFAGDLVLRNVTVSGDTIGALDSKVRLFDNENPTAGETAKANPFQFNATTVPAGGLKVFAQGRGVSGALRDTGFQLGLRAVENDGDRTRLTVVQFSHLVADVPSTSANTPRVHPPVPASAVNSPVARHTFDITNFAEDFAAASTLVLVENSVVAGDLVNLSVRVAPAGVPVRWGVQRDTTAVTGDNAAIIGLNPGRPVPTLAPNAANPLQATLLADNTGSFFIRPFIDCNGNNAYDLGIDKEPFIVTNLVLIRSQGVANSSVANPPANVTTLRAGTLTAVPTPALATTAGFDLTTGNVPAAPGGNTFANPTVSAIHNDATILVIGGGAAGRRGLDRLMAGWVQSELPVATSPTVPPGEDVVAGYDDIAPPPPTRTHQRVSIWRAPGGPATFLPGGAAPSVLAGPFLDVSVLAAAGTGGNTAVGTEGAAGPPVVPPGPPGPPPQPGVTKTPVAPPGVGEQWRVHMWDSPGDVVPAAHGGFPGTLLRYHFNLNFRTDLCVWTNVTGVPGATPDAACRLYSSVQSNTWAIQFNVDVALAPPARPTLSSVAGGPLAPRTDFVQVTYVNAAGETTASAEGSVALAAGRRLVVTSPPASGSATGYNIYVGTTAGSETRQNAAPVPIGTNFTEPLTGLVAGAVPPTTDTSGGLAAPGAAALTSSAAAATTFFAQVTYVNARGETTVSAEASLAVPAGRLLVVTSPRAFGDATGYNVYISAATGTETKQSAAATAIGTNFTMPATGLVAGAAPPAANTTGRPALANSVTLTRDGAPTRLASPVQGSGLEVRGPAGLSVLATDART